MNRFFIFLQETKFPTNVLELLTSCWSHDPEKRPSAKQIEEFSRQPEFCRLLNAWSGTVDVKCACVLVDVKKVIGECNVAYRCSYRLVVLVAEGKESKALCK